MARSTKTSAGASSLKLREYGLAAGRRLRRLWLRYAARRSARHQISEACRLLGIGHRSVSPRRGPQPARRSRVGGEAAEPARHLSANGGGGRRGPPAILFSAKVLSHVHPDEVRAYHRQPHDHHRRLRPGDRHVALERPRHAFSATNGCGPTPSPASSDLVASQGGALAVLAEKQGIGKGMRSGTFRIVQEAKVTPGDPGETAR